MYELYSAIACVSAYIENGKTIDSVSKPTHSWTHNERAEKEEIKTQNEEKNAKENAAQAYE